MGDCDVNLSYLSRPETESRICSPESFRHGGRRGRYRLEEFGLPADEKFEDPAELGESLFLRDCVELDAMHLAQPTRPLYYDDDIEGSYPEPEERIDDFEDIALDDTPIPQPCPDLPPSEFSLLPEFTQPWPPPPRQPSPKWSPRAEIPEFQYNIPRRGTVMSPQRETQLEQIPIYDVDNLTQYTNPCEKFRKMKELMSGQAPASATCTEPPRASPPRQPSPPPKQPGASKCRRGAKPKVAKPKLVQPPMRAGTASGRASSTTICDSVPTHLGGIKLSRAARLKMQMQQEKDKAEGITRKKAEQREPKKKGKQIKKKEEPKSKSVKDHIADMKASKPKKSKKPKSIDEMFQKLPPPVVEFLVQEFLNTSNPPDRAAFIDIMTQQIVNNMPSTSCQAPSAQVQARCRAQSMAQDMFNSLWNTECPQAAAAAQPTAAPPLTTEKVIQTRIDGEGLDCIKETIIELTDVENGEVNTQTKHIVTHRDPNGNVSSHVTESGTDSCPPETQIEECPLTPRRMAQRERQQIEEEFNRYDVLPPNYLVDNLLRYETETAGPEYETEVPEYEIEEQLPEPECSLQGTHTQGGPWKSRYIPQDELPDEDLSDVSNLSIEVMDSLTSNVCDDGEDLDIEDVDIELENACVTGGDPFREVADFYMTSPTAPTGAPCENLMQFDTPRSEFDDFQVYSPPQRPELEYESRPCEASTPLPIFNIERLNKWTSPSSKFQAYKDIMSGKIPACTPPPQPSPRPPSPRPPSPPPARQPTQPGPSRGRRGAQAKTGTRPKAVQQPKKAPAPKVCEPMPTHVGGVKLTRAAQLRLQKQSEKKKADQIAAQKAEKKAEREAIKRGKPIKRTESKEQVKPKTKSMKEFIAERKKQNLPMIKAQAQAEKRLTNLMQELTDQINQTTDALKKKRGCPMPSPKTKATLKQKLDELKAMKQQTQADLDAINVGELPTTTPQPSLAAQADQSAVMDEELPCTSAQAAAAAAMAQTEVASICEPSDLAEFEQLENEAFEAEAAALDEVPAPCAQTLAESRAQMEAEAAQWTPYEGEDEELPLSIKLQYQMLDLGLRNTFGALMFLPQSGQAASSSPTQELLDYEQEERRSCKPKISRSPQNLSMIAEEEEEDEDDDLVSEFRRAERQVFGHSPTSQEPDEELADEMLECSGQGTNIITERFRSPSPLHIDEFPEDDVGDVSCLLDESSDGYIADVSQVELQEESFQLRPEFYQDTDMDPCAEIDTEDIYEEPEAPLSPCPQASPCPRQPPPRSWSPRDEIPQFEYHAPRRSPIIDQQQQQTQLEQMPMFDVGYLKKFTDPCEKFGALRDLTTGRVPVSSTRTPPPCPPRPPSPPPRQPTPPGPSRGRRGVQAKTGAKSKVVKPKFVQPPMRAGKPGKASSTTSVVCEPMPTHLGGVKLSRAAQLRMQKQKQQEQAAQMEREKAERADAKRRGKKVAKATKSYPVAPATPCAQPTVCAQPAVCAPAPPPQRSPSPQRSPIRQKSPSPLKSPSPQRLRSPILHSQRSPPIDPNYYPNQLLDYERELVGHELEARSCSRTLPPLPSESIAEMNEPCMGILSPEQRQYPAFGTMANYVPYAQQVSRTASGRPGHRMSSYAPNIGAIAEEDICESDTAISPSQEQFRNITERVRLDDPLLVDVQSQMQNLGVGNVFCHGTVYSSDTDEELLSFEEAERNAYRDAVGAGEMPCARAHSGARVSPWMPQEEEELPVSIKLQYQMLDLGLPNSFGPLYSLPARNCLSPPSPNNDLLDFLAAEAQTKSPKKYKRSKIRRAQHAPLATIMEQPEQAPCQPQRSRLQPPASRLSQPQRTPQAAGRSQLQQPQSCAARGATVQRPPPQRQRASRPATSCVQSQRPRSNIPSAASESRVAMARQQAAGRVQMQQRTSTVTVSCGRGAQQRAAAPQVQQRTSRPATSCARPQRSQLPSTASESRVAMARRQAAGRVVRPSTSTVSCGRGTSASTSRRAATQQPQAQQPAGACPLSPRRPNN